MKDKNKRKKTNKKCEMMKIKNYSDKSKGITLIALVITIIVLLILAGVSIAMLTGDNGILNKADTARKNTKVAGEREQITMAYNVATMEKLTGEGEVDVTKILETELKKQNKNVQVDAKEGENKTTVTFTDTKNTYEVDNETGEITGPLGTTEGGGSNPSTGDTTGPTVSDNIEYTEPVYTKPTPQVPEGGTLYKEPGTGEKVPIPKGFMYLEGDVETGLVIQDIGTNKSEFVWIQVPYAVATGEDTAEEKIKVQGSATITIDAEDESGIGEITSKTEDNIEKVSDKQYKVTENGEYIFEVTDTKGNSTEHKVQVENISNKEIVTGNKAMAVNMNKDEATKETEPQYRGLLYDFEINVSEKKLTSAVISGCTTTSSSNREPAFLTDATNGDKSSDNNLEITEGSLQSEYNDMIKSVQKYGGFYVGRYEMSLTGVNNNSVDPNGTAQSKPNVRTASAASDELKNWYGLYKKAKTYANDSNQGTTITDSGVVSSLIWGSQYDAMINWMQRNGIYVEFTAMGVADRNKVQITGNRFYQDKISNIYDLLGCNTEWTLEASGTDCRVLRGGNATLNMSPIFRTNTYQPTYTYCCFSGRLTLYIK